MIRIHDRTRGRGDDGLTVVELVVSIALSVVVGTIVITIFLSTLRGQQSVTTTTEATTRGQVVAQSIEKALRNARDVSIEGTNGNTLKVLTTIPGKACQAWRVTAGGELQASSGAGFGTWGTFAAGITAVSGAHFFAQDGASVAYSLGFDAGGRPVTFTGSVLSRTTGGDVGSAC